MIEVQFMPREYRNSDVHSSGFPIGSADTLPCMAGKKRPIERTPFGERLFAAREYAGLSQEELAAMAGVSQSTLAEAEKSGQKSGKTVQIAAACGVDSNWLATGVGTMVTRPASTKNAASSQVANLTPANGGIRNLMVRFAELLSGLDARDREHAADYFRDMAADLSSIDTQIAKMSRLLGEPPHELDEPQGKRQAK